ncbi:YeeE/YedE family protein [Skermanella sp. TT6]|mgnify:CR=1 FL=1|uniref:YeeE/YedE family protein n=1 Tax=Skermanella cutis TaxID=2775420 RepID=A0ABX7B2F5_9PROT|nr:YeeE/YedE family protein [Skermanella sp. TT6]QQP88009.1 YeeE/YedE family protein [Skermanella sp. TT6]
MADITLGRPSGIPAPDRTTDPRVVAVAALLLLGGAVWLTDAVSARQAALYLVGGALGLTLYHALFGFTSSFRVFISDRRGAGIRAQMVMLALACALFFPALAAGELFGQPVAGLVAPVGVSVVFGAFLFGVGMQLGGGCASGTLYTAGGGNTRMIVTLVFFIVGSVVGAAHLHWWSALPSIGPVSLVGSLGALPALALNLAVFAAIAGGTVVLERRRHGALRPGNRTAHRGWQRFVQGPWPLIWGGVALAVLNFATLALAGRPWGITSAFVLWGAKPLDALGFDVAFWPYFSAPERAASLENSIFQDITSVMNFGIILGALLAAGLAGRFAPVWRVPLRSLAAAVVGGLMLGYGARLAYGCNIGAYFSGIASGSLHGWVWLVAALAGNVVGTRLRPLFGLEVEKTPRETAC